MECQASRRQDDLASATPFVPGGLPEDTTHIWDVSFHINRDNQDSSSSKAPDSGDSYFCQVAIKNQQQ